MKSREYNKHSLVPRPEKEGPGTHQLRMHQFVPIIHYHKTPSTFLVTSSCLNLLALQSTLNVPSAEGLLYWIESKLQEENLLRRSFELNAQSPCGKRQYTDMVL